MMILGNQKMQVRELLHSLLEYVIQQKDQPDISRLVLPGTAINPQQLGGLPGVKVDPTRGEEDVWLEVERLLPTKPPLPEPNELSRFLRVDDNPRHPPEIDQANLRLHLEVLHKERDEEKLQAEIHESLAELRLIYGRYMPSWSKWAESEVLKRRSIDLFDTLFAWSVGLTSSTELAQELVAGIALTAWKLPDTGHNYVYPLITVPLELNITASGSVQICPRDTKPSLEFNAFLAQGSISHSGQLRDKAKDLLLDGRKISPFDETTYSDIVSMVAHNLSSRSEVDNAAVSVTASETATYSYAWRIFMRQRSTTILTDDVIRLQKEIENGAEIPEQSVSLVTKLSNETRSEEQITFRGRGGIEGSGGKVQELYFPLPYNREQITIIDQLSKSPGVVVQGPPGTGKTHTIANIISHYLAEGKRVLVTAEKAHALRTVQEKIPEKLRPLVVSRVGTEQEGRAQLQSSIDAILQELSQLNPAIVSENIQHAKSLINRAHEEMVMVDRKVSEIAKAHLSEIDIDGVLQRAEKMADLVINGMTVHGWFDDTLSLNPKNAPPIDQDEFDRLKAARRAVGSSLGYLEVRLPVSEKLPEIIELAELHLALERIRHLEEAERNGQLWRLRSGFNESLVQIKELLARADEIKQAVALIEEQSQDKSWMQELRNKLRHSKYVTERFALERLLPELQEIALARGQFMGRPVHVPNEVFLSPAAIEAIKRGAETGKPLGWMASLMNSDVKEILGQITVSGLNLLAQEDWEWTLSFVKLRDRCSSIFTRWNQFAESFGLPKLELGDAELPVLLKNIEALCRDVCHVHNVALTMDGSLESAASQIFTDLLGGEALHSTEGLASFIGQLKNQLAKAELAYAKVQLSALQAQLSGCAGPVCIQLRQFVQELGSDTPVQDVTARYADLIQELKRIESLVAEFEVIAASARKFEDSGASQFAHRIRTIPSADSGDDPILRQTWRDAWTWARVKTFLEGINDRSELVRLGIERAEIEKKLATLYENVSTQQAWLSLKGSASGKVTTALNRYKTAIQKIGKGTGKGAARYRKDAQDAMLDAAEAIPCWVMTHFQVSETMPSKLGLFDLIIIDEASQSTIDTIPILMRGKKLLVVGDDKQVSPSHVGLSVERIDMLRTKYLTGQPHANVLTPEMSLYDMSMAIYPSQVMLLEHFRCHPSIIAYSNKNYYGDKIRPLRISKTSERIEPPLVSIFTPDGVRSKVKGKAINPVEAEAIIAELRSILSDSRFSNRTIGVISLLGAAQAEYVQKLAFDSLNIGELHKRQFSCGEPSSFQGAERDIILLSMVATPEDCHPLSRRDHEQRLNVAASRARERMYLVHSVTNLDLSTNDLRCNLLAHFSNPEIIDCSTLDSLLDMCESKFEQDVLTELFSRGFKVTPQVRAGGFRIDMVVEGDGDSRLAIECDGDSFHGPEQWPADIARQRSLERAGWMFWRCFASTWKISRQESINDLLATLHRVGVEPAKGARGASILTEARVWRRPAEELSRAETVDDENLSVVDGDVVEFNSGIGSGAFTAVIDPAESTKLRSVEARNDSSIDQAID